jgi:hypothetical protein
VKRIDRLSAAFIAKTPLHCVYIAGPIERRPVKVDVDRLTIGPKEGNKFIFWRRYWLPNGKQARFLAEKFMVESWQDQRQNFARWYWLDVDQAETRLRRLAAEARLLLTANSDVVARAAAVIDRYDEKLSAMNKTGELKPLNRAFKALRIANEKLGRVTPRYEVWLDQQLEVVLNAIVAEYFVGHIQPIDTSQKNDGPPPSENHCSAAQ